MSREIDTQWRKFMKELPHHQTPFSKKNWGNPNHSICSYQGKLKPSIAYHLINIFVPKGGRVLDPFSGVGTIPFEAALNDRYSYGIDISPLAYCVSSAKVHRNENEKCMDYIDELKDYIQNNRLSKSYKTENGAFGFNRSLEEYYHPDTFKEILSARKFIQANPPKSSEQMLVVSCLLHILHGNRPYALSRRSHPIVPYAPTGDYIYKNLVEKLTEKVTKCLQVELPNDFREGVIYLGDSTDKWDDSISDLDAIITSPPFFDSTRFYMANWIRLWFLGWDTRSFENEPNKYIDERQKQDFTVYNPIFEQAKERLKPNGYFVMHLGKSNKCNMGLVLQEQSKHWFEHTRLYDEDVQNCATFGIKDIGTTTDHQYLVMY